VVKPYGMSYLPSYKISQNRLEVFFSAMRRRGEFNNNTNAIQLFRSAYKRSLVIHEISALIVLHIKTALCWITQILNHTICISANKRNIADALCRYNDDDGLPVR